MDNATPKQQAVGSTPAGFTNWIKAARSGKEFDENPERALFLMLGVRKARAFGQQIRNLLTIYRSC